VVLSEKGPNIRFFDVFFTLLNQIKLITQKSLSQILLFAYKKESPEKWIASRLVSKVSLELGFIEELSYTYKSSLGDT
jgi:hypothetical protein